MTQASIDYTETVNLFNVSFGKGLDGLNQYYEQAMNFQEKLEEKLGVNIEQSMRYQALFNSMSKSMGIGAKYAYTLSENMTKLGYDLASLYNIEPEEAMTKLRAGLAGQTEPLRELGLDITEQSLKPVAESLGIEEGIRNMSQAEKIVLRYIAVLKQAQIAQGDFANTMESPANQLRIFNSQVEIFKRNMGNLWQGLLGNILPYINGIIMVINELLKMLAELFGFEIKEQDVNLSANIGAEDLSDDLDDANDSAKKLKAQVLGFDEINNISLNDNKSSGVSGSSVGGIEQRLLDAMKGYDNLMDSISNKALQIKNRILDWLGVFDGTYDNLNKIKEVIIGIGVAFGTWKISSFVTNFLKNLGKMNAAQAFRISMGITLAITGITLQALGTERMLNGDIDIFSILESALGKSAGAFGIATLLKDVGKGKHAKTLNLGQRLKIGYGVMIAVQGIQVSASGIKEKDLEKQMIGALETGLGAGMMASGAGKGLKYSLKMGLLVSVAAMEIEVAANIGTWWNEYWDKWKENLYADKQELNLGEMLNVGLTGVGEGLVATLTGADKAIKDLKNTTDEAIKSYEDFKNSIDDTIASSYSEISVAETLSQQLVGLVDSNGKVKKGYEERVDFIIDELNESFDMELSRDGDIIKKNGEIVNSNKDLQDSIEETIKKRKKEIEQEVYQDLYKQSLEEKIKLQMQLNKAYDEQKKAQEKLIELQNSDASWTEITKAKEILRATTNEVNTLENSVADASETVMECDKKMTQSMIESSGVLSEEMVTSFEVTAETLQSMVKDSEEKWEENYNNMSEYGQLLMLTQSTTLDTWCPVLQEKWQQMAQGSTEKFITALNEVDPNVQAQILANITTTEEMTPQMVEAWSNLATNSFEDFKTALSKTNPETQAQILASITTTENLTPELKEAWTNLATQSKDEYNKTLSTLPSEMQLLIQTITNTTQELSPDQIQAWADLAKNNKSAYENNLTGLDNTTRSRIQSCVDAINNKNWTAEEAARGLADAVERGVETVDTTEAGRQAVNGVTKGINNNKDNPSLWNAISGLVGNITSWFKDLFGIASPSKVMAALSAFIPLGIAEGIDDNANEAVKSVKSMAKDINAAVEGDAFKTLKSSMTIRPEKYSVDTSQFIDYGTIAGNIATQTEIDVTEDVASKVGQACYNAFTNALRNQGIRTDIEIKPDKEGIFKAVQKSATEFMMQFGEDPFPSLG